MARCADREPEFSFHDLQCFPESGARPCDRNLWLLAGPIVNSQYPYVRQASSDMHPHILVIDALERRSPSDAGELLVQDLREGSYRICAKWNRDRRTPLVNRNVLGVEANVGGTRPPARSQLAASWTCLRCWSFSQPMAVFFSTCSRNALISTPSFRTASPRSGGR